MDLGLLYSNFAMDNKDLTLHTSPDGSGVFRDTDGQTYCTIRPFNHADPDLARDPFSTNRRFFDSGEIELFGTMVVAGTCKSLRYNQQPSVSTHTTFLSRVDQASDCHISAHCRGAGAPGH